MVAVSRFFGWCEQHRISELADIEPLHVAAYIEVLGQDFEKPTVKQHLAGIRMLFDWLVTGQIVATNPAHAVRGPKHVVWTGKTTVLDTDQARTLLDSIDISTVVGLRDRALIALITYSFARVSAAVAMDVEDYHPKGKRWWVRLHEKGTRMTIRWLSIAVGFRETASDTRSPSRRTRSGSSDVSGFSPRPGTGRLPQDSAQRSFFGCRPAGMSSSIQGRLRVTV
jgi:site-specific recombinase XerD